MLDVHVLFLLRIFYSLCLSCFLFLLLESIEVKNRSLHDLIHGFHSLSLSLDDYELDYDYE